MIYLDEILQGVKTVGITGHIRPDGDCVGSTLGVYNYICDNMPQKKLMGISYTIYLSYATVQHLTGLRISGNALRKPGKQLYSTTI